jgi:hypothetical protein
MLLFALITVAACGSSTQPAAVEVDVLTPARPKTTFAVVNHTTQAVGLLVCGHDVGVAFHAESSEVNICLQTQTTTLLLAGATLTDSVSISDPGNYKIFVALSDGSTRSSPVFSVP